MNGRHLVNKRHDIAQELHQPAHAHVFVCTHAENREDAARNHSLADALAHLVLSEMFGFKKLLHQLLVILRRGLHQLFVQRLGLFGLIVRNLADGGFAAVGH